jgi:hypothetical protein
MLYLDLQGGGNYYNVGPPQAHTITPLGTNFMSTQSAQGFPMDQWVNVTSKSLRHTSLCNPLLSCEQAYE